MSRPKTPETAVKPKSESEIKREILAFLVALPRACFTTKVSGCFMGKGRKIYKTGTDGAADIIGCYEGLAVAIETKRSKGTMGGTSKSKQLASQIAWQLNWEQAKGIYIVARSVDEVMDKLLGLQKAI